MFTDIGLGHSLSHGISDSIDPTVSSRAAEIIADGGVVEDIGYWDSFIKYAKYNTIFSFYNDIIFAGSPSWGRKGVTNASKIYEIIGASPDLTQVAGVRQPLITVNDLIGKTRLTADGISHSMNTAGFVLAQPYTVIFMGLEQESWTNNDHLCSGVNAGSGVVFQFTATPDIHAFSGTVSTPTSDAILTTPVHLRALFNGASSALQVDDNVEVASDFGAATAGGIYLFSDHAMAKNAHISLGAYVVLDSAVDANYAAKMAAIKAFSAAAYGTA